MSRQKWATYYEFHRNMKQAAERGITKALDLRCPEELESGVARCTADAVPAHEHRYDREDLPS